MSPRPPNRPAWVNALVKCERRKARVAERGRMLKAHQVAETAWRASHNAEVEGLNRAINTLMMQRDEARARAEHQKGDALTETAGAVRALNDANLGNARLREACEEWKQRALRAEGALAERHKRFGDARETVVDVQADVAQPRPSEVTPLTPKYCPDCDTETFGDVTCPGCGLSLIGEAP